jgi:hypothetical protein
VRGPVAWDAGERARIAPVVIDARARRAWPVLRGLAYAEPGTVLVGDCGEVLRVREDGGAEPVLPPGHPRPGIASDPTATRRAG